MYSKRSLSFTCVDNGGSQLIEIPAVVAVTTRVTLHTFGGKHPAHAVWQNNKVTTVIGTPKTKPKGQLPIIACLNGIL